MSEAAKSLATDNTGLEGWVRRLVHLNFPLLTTTASLMRGLDSASGESMNRLCNALLMDAGAVLHMLRRVNGGPRGRLSGDVTTLEHAAMMMGLEQVRKLPDSLEKLNLPAKSPRARGYLQVLSRSYHAAYQVYEWSIYSADMTPKELVAAALLHDIGELAMWLGGGAEPQRIIDLMHEERMPADEAQYVVLGFSYEQLSLALAKAWRLPQVIVDALKSTRARDPRVLRVMLGCQLARLAEDGWYRQAVLDCLEDVAKHLDRPFEKVVEQVHQTAIAAARETENFGAIPAAALLPMLPSAEDEAEQEAEERQRSGKTVGDQESGGTPKHFCLTPMEDVYLDAVKTLKSPQLKQMDLNTIVHTVLRGMHDGLGLNRVVFTMLNREKSGLRARSTLGTDNDPGFGRLDIGLHPPNLFTRLMAKQQAVWVADENRKKIWPLVPDDFRRLIHTNSFFAMSVFVSGKPVGLFYADRHVIDCHLDENAYKRFKLLCQLTGRAIERVTAK